MTKVLEKVNSKPVTLRVTIVAILVAINFGIMQYLGDKVELQIFEPVLKVIASVFTNIALIIFLLYIIALGVANSHKLAFRKKVPHEFLFDFGISLSVLIVFISTMFYIGFYLASIFNNNIYFIFIYMTLITISGGVIFIILISNNIQKLLPKKYSIKKFSREDKKFLFQLILTILAIVLSFIFFSENTRKTIELSENSLNKTFLLTTPVTLTLNETVNETEGRWYINVTNSHPLRETGAIYLYRLEKNSDKPHMLVEEGLKPGESRLFSLAIKTEEEEILFNQQTTNHGYVWNFPIEAYYVNEEVSISIKIICDNCPSQGVMRRLPGFGDVDYRTTLNKTGVKAMKIPIYEWVDFSLEDIRE
ncbi:hypothetical protein HQ533_06080 [Candidatus Woesearchaeota archaeon]|nr:hypothetical protein [Candidatus Woesearchaeota archaeon]